MMQLQQLQRQTQQICEEMMSLQNAVGHVMNQLQVQVATTRLMAQPSNPSQGFGTGAGRQPYVPGSVYGAPRPTPSSIYQPLGSVQSSLLENIEPAVQNVRTPNASHDGVVGRQSEHASYARLT